MSDTTRKEWVLPAEIPFSILKSRDLEECVFWLLDAMGAKDIQWRTGGTGIGAADGGRDIEASFYSPTLDGEMEIQKWWIECKGRSTTVDSDDVKFAVNNSLAREGLDYLIIATNTQFSNPTRDWLANWQAKFPKPKVKLWDHAYLERFLSRHPDVVLRLFSEALSLDGRFQAMETQYWNKLQYVTPGVLKSLWKSRESIEGSGMGWFAAAVNEFAIGNIIERPWGAFLAPERCLDALCSGLGNLLYLYRRYAKWGAEQNPLFRALAYFAMCTLLWFDAKRLANLVIDTICRGNQETMPTEIKNFLLEPVLNQLFAELQDLCSSDCKRISQFDYQALKENDDEIETYWERFEPNGLVKPDKTHILRMEKQGEKCTVGFSVDKDIDCPLFGIEPTVNNIEDAFIIAERVLVFRREQANARRVEKQK